MLNKIIVATNMDPVEKINKFLAARINNLNFI